MLSYSYMTSCPIEWATCELSTIILNFFKKKFSMGKNFRKSRVSSRNFDNKLNFILFIEIIGIYFFEKIQNYRRKLASGSFDRKFYTEKLKSEYLRRYDVISFYSYLTSLNLDKMNYDVISPHIFTSLKNIPF